MPNELFKQMQGQQSAPMEQDFMRFMNQMRGQNPGDIINGLVQSGKLSQSQLNAVQQRAGQMIGGFGALRKKFGF